MILRTPEDFRKYEESTLCSRAVFSRQKRFRHQDLAPSNFHFLKVPEFFVICTDQHQSILSNGDISITSAIHFHSHKADPNLSSLKHRVDSCTISFAKLIAYVWPLLQESRKHFRQNALRWHSRCAYDMVTAFVRNGIVSVRQVSRWCVRSSSPPIGAVRKCQRGGSIRRRPLRLMTG